MRRFPFAVLVPLGLTGCQAPTPALTEDAKTAIAAEVNAAAAAWWDAWAAVDYPRGMAFVEDAPEAAWSSGEGTVFTLAGMNAGGEGVWGADWRSQQIDFTESRTIVLAADVACSIRQYDGVITDTAGVVRPRTKGVETVVWVKRNGQWKVLLGHESVLQESWQTWLAMQAK